MGARWEDIVHPLLHGDMLNLKDVLEKMPKLQPMAGYPSVEVECWVNPLTGEVRLGVANTPVPEGYWRGRADRIGWYEHPEHGLIPAVMDYKTGNPHWQSYGDCPQIGYFAVWLAVEFEVDYVYGIIYCTQDPEHPRGHLWTRDDITRMFRAMHHHEARLQLLEQNDEMPEPVENKGCTFCPVRPQCPLWLGRKAEKDAKREALRRGQGEGAVPAVRDDAGEEGVRLLSGMPAVPQREEGDD